MQPELQLDRLEAFETVNADGTPVDDGWFGTTVGAEHHGDVRQWNPDDDIAKLDDVIAGRVRADVIAACLKKGNATADDVTVSVEPRSRNVIGNVLMNMARVGELEVIGRVTCRKANGHRRKVNLYRLRTS